MLRLALGHFEKGGVNWYSFNSCDPPFSAHVGAEAAPATGLPASRGLILAAWDNIRQNRASYLAVPEPDGGPPAVGVDVKELV